MTNLIGDSNDPNVAAVRGDHTAGAAAIIGQSNEGRGVLGISDIGQGVWGASTSSSGVVGISQTGVAISGQSDTNTGVLGISKTGFAVHGAGDAGSGVVGQSEEWAGVVGFTNSQKGGPGVWGEHKMGGSGVFGLSDSGIGIHGRGGRLAGFFEGDVEVTGDIRLANADCAEDFDIIDAHLVEPGTVMVLAEGGRLRESREAYDKRVAGVISGAGDYKPGIVLDKQNSQASRAPIALLGKVYCKIDASYAPIEVGDMLTTAPTPGHAMKADDPMRAFGAVIGKALCPLPQGQGLIPILIALQ